MGDFRASQARTVPTKRQRKPNVRLGDIGEWQVLRQRKKPRRNDSNARMETAAAKAVGEDDHGLAPDEIDLAKSLSTLPFGEFYGKLKDYDKLGDVQDGGIVDASKSRGSRVISRNRVRKGKEGRAGLAKFSMVDALVAAASSAEENANQAGGISEEDNVSDDTKEIAAMLMDTDGASAAEEGCLTLAMAGSMEYEKDRSSADVSDFEDEKNLMQDFAAAAAAAAGNTRTSNATDEEAPLPAEKESDRLASLKNGVHGWLHELKLDRYADLFELHEVDPGVVPMLTMEDLEEMGIVAVGPRRKIFHEIQQLRKKKKV